MTELNLHKAIHDLKEYEKIKQPNMVMPKVAKVNPFRFPKQTIKMEKTPTIKSWRHK